MSKKPIVIIVEGLEHPADLMPMGLAAIPCTILLRPNVFGPITDAMHEIWQNVAFAMHGFEGTRHECNSWTSDQAQYLITLAEHMGYTPIFCPPDFTWDGELEKALANTGTVLLHLPSQNPKAKNIPFFPGSLAARQMCGEPELLWVTAANWVESERLSQVLENQDQYDFLFADNVAMEEVGNE